MKLIDRILWFLGTSEGKRVKAVHDIYSETFNNKSGELVIIDLIAESALLSGKKDLSERDILINEGKRQMIVHILDRSNLPIEKFVQLHKSFYTRSIEQ